MPDLFDPLRPADGQPTVPVAATEIRRRGDRLRRRRTAGQVLATACVVGALVTGASLVAGHDRLPSTAGPAGGTPSPVPSPASRPPSRPTRRPRCRRTSRSRPGTPLRAATPPSAVPAPG